MRKEREEKNKEIDPEETEVNIKHTNYKREVPAKVSEELFNPKKWLWKMEVHPYRLLMMLSQTVDKDNENMFFGAVHEWPLETIFKYLGIESSNKRYDVMYAACKDLASTCFSDVQELRERGAKRYVGITIIQKFEFCTDRSWLRIKINPDATKILSKLRRYALIQPRFYLKLDTMVQNTLYPYLKLQAPMHPQWTISLQELKEILGVSQTPSYNQGVNANTKFLNKVLGLERPKGKLPKGTPWDFTRNDKGEYIGNLISINAHKDLAVTASPVKTGRSYTHITFYLALRKKLITKKELMQQTKKNLNVDADMGKIQERRGRKGAQKISDALPNKQMTLDFTQSENFVPVVNEVPIKADAPAGVAIVSAETMRMQAAAEGTTEERVAARLNYKKRPDGNYEKHSS